MILLLQFLYTEIKKESTSVQKGNNYQW